jgi:hypothetical protein
MNEQELHEYTQWLMEVWNPNQLYIPFAVDAPKAYLRHKAEQLNLPPVIGRSEQLKAFLTWLEKEGGSPFIDKDALINKWIKSL